MGLFTSRKTVFVDSDILVIGGGFGGCGAAHGESLRPPVLLAHPLTVFDLADEPLALLFGHGFGAFIEFLEFWTRLFRGVILTACAILACAAASRSSYSILSAVMACPKKRPPTGRAV